jgi:hypothetical protein
VEGTVDSEWIEEFAPLREILLGFGGKYFPPVAQMAQHFPPIFFRQMSAIGHVFPGADATFVPPSEGICRPDPYVLASRNDLDVWTGFALGVDMWQLHTWIVRNNTIVDVDRQRAFYFGFKLNVGLRPFVPRLVTASNVGSGGNISWT